MPCASMATAGERSAKEDPLVAELRLLCRDEVALIEERTALVNQLQSASARILSGGPRSLRGLDAAGRLGLCGSLPHPSGADRGRQTQMGKVPPQPQAWRGRKPMPNAWRSSRGRSELVRRGSAHPHQEPAGADPHRMLRVLQNQIEAYRAEIEKLFAQHPDHDLFGSLPGAGQNCPALAGRNWLGSRPL